MWQKWSISRTFRNVWTGGIPGGSGKVSQANILNIWRDGKNAYYKKCLVQT